jgi:hypothetical protein
MNGWGPELVKRRPDITMEMVDKFLTKMYRTNADFVWTVTRDFVRNCRTPVLILPDDTKPHPYAVAMESAMLAPKAEVSMFPWKEPKERIPLAVRQIRSWPIDPLVVNCLECGPSDRTVAHPRCSALRVARTATTMIAEDTISLRNHSIALGWTRVDYLVSGFTGATTPI